LFETARVRSRTTQEGIQLKEKSLGVIIPYSFKGRLLIAIELIAIEEKWNNFFQDTPKFEAVIDKNGRYTLHGPKVSHSPRNADPTAAQEETVDE